MSLPESYNKCNPQHSTGVIFTRSKYRLQGHDSDSMGLESCCPDTNHFSSSYSPCCAVLCLVAQSCPTLCDPLDCSPPGSSVHGESPGKTTGVGCHALLQDIFPTQGSNPGLPHCRWIPFCLSHQESHIIDLPLSKLFSCLLNFQLRGFSR